MSTRFIGQKSLRVVARGLIALFGCLAIWWGIFELPTFWRESQPERVASQIIAGEPFRIETLAQQLESLGNLTQSVDCRPAMFRSATIIQARLLDVASAKSNREKVNQSLNSLSSTVRASLSCAPTDPFLWLTLYWVERARSGFTPQNFKYLKMSYELGPNEGWISLKRNPIALADLDRLPTELAFDAIREFVALLSGGFDEQAVKIFSAAPWPARYAILPHLSIVPLWIRKKFARALYYGGLDVKVPGVDLSDSDKPWHR